MKQFLLMLSLCFATGFAIAQQAIISAKKIYLKVDGKVSDSLIIPIVSAKYPALKKALTDSLIFDGQTLEEVLATYADHGSGITGLDYTVTYQNNGVISLKLSYETMGAYPDTYQKWLNFSIANGKSHPLSVELTQAGIQKIFAGYKADLQRELKNSKSRMTGEDKESIKDMMLQLTASVFDLKVGDLNGHYLFTKKGILITSEKVLPHATQAFDLDRDRLIPYNSFMKYRKLGAAVIR